MMPVMVPSHCLLRKSRMAFIAESDVASFALGTLEKAERLYHFRHFATTLDNFLECRRRTGVPFPRILERCDLRRRLRAVAFSEEDVVVLGGVERRIQVDKVHRLVLHVATKDVYVVAVEQQVLGHRQGRSRVGLRIRMYAQLVSTQQEIRNRELQIT